MNAIYGLYCVLAILSSTASADPVVIPLVKTSSGDLSAVVPNETFLAAILVGNALQLIFMCGKGLWEIFRKDKDKMDNKVDALASAVQELRAEIKAMSRLPDESEILERLEQRAEYLVFKAVRDLERNK